MYKILSIMAYSTFLYLQSKNAYAYVDPGTGSFLLQLLIASLLGAAFTLKKYYNGILKKFSHKLTKINKILINKDNCDKESMGIQYTQKSDETPKQED